MMTFPTTPFRYAIDGGDRVCMAAGLFQSFQNPPGLDRDHVHGDRTRIGLRVPGHTRLVVMVPPDAECYIYLEPGDPANYQPMPISRFHELMKMAAQMGCAIWVQVFAASDKNSSRVTGLVAELYPAVQATLLEGADKYAEQITMPNGVKLPAVPGYAEAMDAVQTVGEMSYLNTVPPALIGPPEAYKPVEYKNLMPLPEPAPDINDPANWKTVGDSRVKRFAPKEKDQPNRSVDVAGDPVPGKVTTAEGRILGADVLKDGSGVVLTVADPQNPDGPVAVMYVNNGAHVLAPRVPSPPGEPVMVMGSEYLPATKLAAFLNHLVATNSDRKDGRCALVSASHSEHTPPQGYFVFGVGEAFIPPYPARRRTEVLINPTDDPVRRVTVEQAEAAGLFGPGCYDGRGQPVIPPATTPDDGEADTPIEVKG